MTSRTFPAKQTFGMGLVGPGFVARHHVDAVRRLGNVDVVALAGSNLRSTRIKAREWNVGQAYDDYHALIADPRVDVVHNTTPNHLHFDVCMAALRAGKHVISDKPLTLDAAQSRALHAAALKARVAHVVTFNYRGNPMVQQARALIADKRLGTIGFVHGHYLQDWLSDEKVTSWRQDPSKGGASSALGDIGSHWCDLAEHVSGMRIAAVLADLGTLVARRGGRKIVSEDLASVLLRFDSGAKGCFSVGQVLPGHKNDFALEINGRAMSLRWQQERQNDLWLGRYNAPSEIQIKDPASLSAAARRYTHLPAGHQEGWADAFRNLIADAYEWIARGASASTKPAALPTFADGYRSNCLVDAMLHSHRRGGIWQKVKSPLAAKKGNPR